MGVRKVSIRGKNLYSDMDSSTKGVIKMKKTNKSIKNKIKILFIGVLMLASALLISAGDIIFKAGSLDVSQDLVVSNKLGIGTSSPSEKLEIKDGALYIHGASNGMGRVIMGMDGYSQFEWYPKTTGLHLYDRTADAMRINVLNNGNVGIGTATPERELTVKGRINLQGTSSYIAGSSDTQRLDLFSDGGATNGLSLLRNGNLGIGTSNPLTNLHIKGTVPSIRLEDSGWQDWDIKAARGGGGIARFDILRSGGTVNVMSLVEISGGGKMGIGTTNPQATLHLKQTSGITGIRMENDWQSWDIVTSKGNLFFKRAEGAITEMTLAEGGKLGIGTTTPTERIEVVGAIKASEFKTGDITFNKDGKPVWRMFEDENGLYVESLTTGKIYSVMLKEISTK